jgi:Tfp pilus assembly protein PilX
MTEPEAQRPRLADEEGWVMATAIMLLAVMLALGLATFALVDSQQTLSRVERQKETAFNLAEGALNAEIFALSSHWPGQGTAVAGSGLSAWPTCTPSSTDTRCPDPATLTNLFASPDTAGGGATWQTAVYDNGTNGSGQSSAAFYSDTVTTAQPSYDANGDGRVWVRSSATVRGQQRVLVALVQVQPEEESLPHAALIAGSLQISNNGRKVIIDTQGSGSFAAPVEVRCNPLLNLNCEPSAVQLAKGQISPNTLSANYAGGSGLSAAALARLETTAIDNGTYYATCPGSLPSAPIVWIDSGSCSYTANSPVNSQTAPGVLILNSATLTLGGTLAFYGLIYAVNAQASSGAVVSLQGNVSVQGGIEEDGNGGVIAGSSKVNLVFDDTAFGGVKSYGTASLLQNSFREIPHT